MSERERLIELMTKAFNVTDDNYNESLQEDNNLYWQKHDSHLDILKEFYYHNKYILTEQMKDTLLDAINCMEYVIKNQIK